MNQVRIAGVSHPEQSTDDSVHPRFPPGSVGGWRCRGIPELLACPKALLELLEQTWLEVSLQGEQREEQGGCFGIWVSAWSHPTSLARPLVLLLEMLPFASFQNCQWKGMNLSDGGTLEVQK